MNVNEVMMISILRAIREGYTYDNSDSDLDNEQPIPVSMTLGDYHKADQIFHRLTSTQKGSS